MMLRSILWALMSLFGAPAPARDEAEVFRSFRRALERVATSTRGRDIATG
jgi:hypothetical protein